MKPYAANTSKGRTVAVDDIHHRTADQPREAAKAAAKRQKHAARQEGRREALEPQANPDTEECAGARKGRPPLPPGMGRTEVIRMRATPAERQAYDQLGGDSWLRGLLDTGGPRGERRRARSKATEPQTQH